MFFYGMLYNIRFRVFNPLGFLMNYADFFIDCPVLQAVPHPVPVTDEKHPEEETGKGTAGYKNGRS